MPPRKRDFDPHSMAMVVAPVQIDPHIHIPVLNGRGFPARQHQPELVKSAARRPVGIPDLRSTSLFQPCAMCSPQVGRHL